MNIPFNQSTINNMSHAEQLRYGLLSSHISSDDAEMLVYDAGVGCDAQYALDCHLLETPENENQFESLIDDLKANSVKATEELECACDNLELLLDKGGCITRKQVEEIAAEMRKQWSALLDE